MHRRAVAALVLALCAVAACSDDAPSAADGTAPTAAATDGTGGSTGDDDGSAGGGATDGDNGAAGGTTVPGSGGTNGSGTTKPGGGTTATTEGGSSATTTLPPVMPPPPVVGCVDAPAGPAIVELSFDDDTLRYAGAVAPPCVRIHAAQKLRLVNAAGFSSGGSIGTQTFTLAQGSATTTAVLGSTRSVGDVFDVRVNVISATVVVQVLP